MTRRPWLLSTAVAACAVSALGLVAFVAARDADSAGSSRSGGYAPEIDPTEFTTQIDNPYLPLQVGTTWVYGGESADGIERTEVEVMTETREVMGVEVIVVRDTETVDDVKTEEAFDFYAQDREGNVWYFGTETIEYENGQPETTGESWEAGTRGAQPGIVMEARPAVGDTYRLQYAPGIEEDMAEVVALHERASVPFGSLDGVLKIADSDPNEPGLVHYAYYVAGVGVVLEEGVSPDGVERVQLVEVVKP